MFAVNAFTPTAILSEPVVLTTKDPEPTAVLLSPLVMAVPELYPIRVLLAASVPVKLSPALVPILVLYCASDASITFFAVNIPA